MPKRNRHTITLKITGTEFSLNILLTTLACYTVDASRLQRAMEIKCVRKDGSETPLEFKDVGDCYLTFRKTDIPWNKPYPIPEKLKHDKT